MEEKDIKKFTPIAGLITYKRDEEYYLQSHEIIRKGSTFTWGSGKPFQRDHLNELVATLKKETLSALKMKGLMPTNVLYFQPSVSGSKFIWHLSPKKYHLTFNTGSKDGDYFMPGLIFAVSDRKLTIMAYKGSERPDENTELFHAPFYNTESNGVVCMGTISESRKRKFLEEEIDRWERRFFGGVFTSAHWSDKRLKKGTLAMLLKSVYRKSSFPEDLLVKHKNETLGLFLKNFISNNHEKDYYED